MCHHPGCKKYPFYNFQGEAKPIFCPDHKLDGMIDVKMKRCEVLKCMKRATCGVDIKRFCSEHKQKGMIDIVLFFWVF
jgi:hypothetical protein